jgi:hypothetical protein
MEERTMFKPSEVEGKTRFKLEGIIEISKEVIESLGGDYELETKTVLYDKSFYITKEPVWYVDIIAILHKKRFPDAYETLVISDVTGKAIYKLNNHGVAHNI